MFGIKMPKIFGSKKSASGPDPLWGRGSATSFLGLMTQNGVSYKDSVWILGGVEHTAKAIASLPLLFTDRNGVTLDREKFRGEQVKWVDLSDKLNPLLTFTQGIEKTAMLYLIYGGAFWIKRNLDNSLVKSALDVPEKIDVVSPLQVEPRFADVARSVVVGWLYKDAMGMQHPLQFHHVVRFYRTNPESDVFGLPIWAKVGSAMYLDSAIKSSHRDIFDNGGRSHGWFQSSKRVDEAALKRFKADYEEKFTGRGNYGKAFLTPDGIEYKPDKDVRDMDYEKLSKQNRDEEFGATCVPKHHLGVTDNLNYATAEITDTAYWLNEIVPLKRNFEDSINADLMLGSGMRVKFDIKDVPVLAHAAVKLLDSKLRVATRYYRLGQPLNKITRTLELPIEEIDEDWANQPHDPLVEIGTEEPTVTDSGSSQSEKTHKLKAVSRDPFDVAFDGLSLVKGQLAKETTVGDVAEKDDLDLAYEGDEDAMERVIKEIEEDTILPLVPGMTKTMESYINRLGKSQLTRLDAFFSGREFHGKADEGTNERRLTQSDINLVLFDQTKWDEIIIADSLPYHKRAYSASIRRMRDELDGFSLFEQTDTQAASIVREINKPIVGINHRLRERMRQDMSKLVEAGASNSAIIDSVRNELDVELKRASMIARTETGMAASKARFDVLGVEVETKRWLSARDSVVRKTHQHYNAKGSVPVSYEYAPGLRYPLDQGAEAGEVINCRCVLVAGNRPTKKPKQ
jgi:phage portal protein BeeE